MKTISLTIMAIFYILAGLNHFRAPEFYKPIMPPYLPAHDLLILLSGIAEVGLGILLLIPAARPWAAWGIIAMLIAIFPANWYMFQERNTVFASMPTWLLIARLPLQALLIAWAYSFTRA